MWRRQQLTFLLAHLRVCRSILMANSFQFARTAELLGAPKSTKAEDGGRKTEGRRANAERGKGRAVRKSKSKSKRTRRREWKDKG